MRFGLVREFNFVLHLELTITKEKLDMRPIKSTLILASLILLCSLASPAAQAGTVHNNKTTAPVPGNSVVTLDTSINGTPNVSIEVTEALALGFDVVINDAATWGSMTLADFASYRAIILGDPSCQLTTGPLAAAEANRTTWSPAITGNMIIIGVDPAVHPDNSTPSKGTELTRKGIAFAAADPTKPGAYITLSCYYATQGTAIPLLLLDQFDTGFVVKQAPSNFNNAHIVATHPAFAGLTDAELSNWNDSVHEVIEQWPVTFQVFAIALNSGTVFTATDGTTGTPYILTRGATVISNIKLGPDEAINPVGTTHTVTATISPVPPPGTPVTFKVISGPNAGTLNPPVGTNASGVASKTYTDTGGAGTDFIVATYVNADGKVQTSNTVKKTWVEEGPKACADVVTREISCKMDGSGAITYTFSVTNNTGQTVSNVLLTPPAGSTFTLSQQQFSVALAPGQTQALTVVVTGVTPGQKVCFTVTLGNFTEPPATKDCSECCCSIEVCFVVPTCDCVQFIDESLQPVKGKPNTFTYTFVIKNPLPTTIEHIYIYAPTGYTMTPSYLPVSIAPGGIFTGTITMTSTPGVKSCFSISFHDKAMKKCCTMRHCIALK
jgi:hypothetical protein